MGQTTFEAVIIPHRSLGERGARWLACALVLPSVIVSSVLWWQGAWPVAGFAGVEIALAIVLLRRHARVRRSSEVLLLSPDGLRMVRTAPGGRASERVMDGAWLRATLEERPGRVPALWLASRGQRYEVAAGLGELEKRDLAAALRTALHRLQHPVFDNPQLR